MKFQRRLRGFGKDVTLVEYTVYMYIPHLCVYMVFRTGIYISARYLNSKVMQIEDA